MRKINEIIVHCTATPEGRDFSVAQIDSMHRQRGFDGIGYHYLIGLDGSIRNGRPVERVGAHVAGRNANTIGVSYIGGVTTKNVAKDTRTDAQKKALDKLLNQLVSTHTGIKRVSGHREYANKACPCFDASAEYINLIPSSRTTYGFNSDPVEGEEYRIIERGFSLLDEPFGTSKITLDKDALVRTTGGFSGDWLSVTYNGQIGWIHVDAIDQSEVSQPLAPSRTMQGTAVGMLGVAAETLTSLGPALDALGAAAPWISTIAKLCVVGGLLFAAYAKFSESRAGVAK